MLKLHEASKEVEVEKFISAKSSHRLEQVELEIKERIDLEYDAYFRSILQEACENKNS